MENQPDELESGAIAAIDIGSNSFHLITARINNGALQPLVMDKQIVRLADGLSEDGKLSEEAIERGLNVLRSFALTIGDIAPESIRVVATYTLRRAQNAYDFISQAKEFMPVPVEIISGDEEARLIYQGVAHTSHHEGQRLIVDIGGGSTEFAIGKGFTILQLSSQPLGCVVFTKKYFSDGTITPAAFRATELAAQQRLEVIYRRFLSSGWDIAFGSSGTVKAISQYLQINNPSFEGKITLVLLHWMREQFIAAGDAASLSGVDDARRAVLPAGLAILIAIFEQLEIQEMSVSEAALREGVLYELPDRMRHHDVRERTVDSLMLRYDVDTTHVTRVLKTATHLHQALNLSSDQQNKEIAADFLRWSVSLHEIGLQINRRAIQRHSAYIVQNAELPGFSNEEQDLLATLLSSYRKRFQSKDFKGSDILSRSDILWLVVVMRLAILLNIRRLDDFAPDILPSVIGNKIQLKFPVDWLNDNPLAEEDLKSEAKSLMANNIELKWQ